MLIAFISNGIYRQVLNRHFRKKTGTIFNRTYRHSTFSSPK